MPRKTNSRRTWADRANDYCHRMMLRNLADAVRRTERTNETALLVTEDGTVKEVPHEVALQLALETLRTQPNAGHGVVTISKKKLRKALGCISGTELRNRIQSGEIKFLGKPKKNAKTVRLDISQFTKDEQAKIREVLKLPN